MYVSSIIVIVDVPVFLFFATETALITRTMRTIYVERQDPDSRMKAAEEIRRRTHTRGEWPKVLIFPEGPRLPHTVTTQCASHFFFHFYILLVHTSELQALLLTPKH